jgi:hypothetical protein
MFSRGLLDIHLWGHLKALLHLRPIENEETLLQGNFYACQTIRNLPGIFAKVLQSTIR